jgi:thiamine-phosphate pyrophosphorylase
VLALAGVTAATVGTCLAAGASGVAVMGEVMRAQDTARVVRELVAACETVAKREALAANKETGGATPGSSV